MTTVQPARPVPLPVSPDVRASALAAWQLVEDARYRLTDQRPRRDRARTVALRTVADRKAERDLRAS